MNKVYLIGNLGGDPIKSTFDNGVKCSFALATSESYKVEGEWKSFWCILTNINSKS